MTAYEQFWIVVFLAMVICIVCGNVIDRRRKRSFEEFERRHLDRKAEVERSARKSL